MSASQTISIAILISGNGSNLQALLDSVKQGLDVDIKVVISNHADAFGLERARKAGADTAQISVAEKKLEEAKAKREAEAKAKREAEAKALADAKAREQLDMQRKKQAEERAKAYAQAKSEAPTPVTPPAPAAPAPPARLCAGVWRGGRYDGCDWPRVQRCDCEEGVQCVVAGAFDGAVLL